MSTFYIAVILILLGSLGFSFYYIFNLKKAFKSMLETEDKFYHTNNQELMSKLNEQDLLISELSEENKYYKEGNINLIWAFSDLISDFYDFSLNPNDNTNVNLNNFLSVNNSEVIKNISMIIPVLSSFKNNKISSEKYMLILEEINLDGIVLPEMEIDDIINFTKYLLITNDIIYSIEKLNEYVEIKKEES